MLRRSYSDLRQLTTFEDRFKYLMLHGEVGASTFGFDRYMNQRFYTSREWRQLRHHIIARDEACDMGVKGYDIHEGIYIHHLNPMTVADIRDGSPSILDPDNLISVTHQTHNAIHYGDINLLPQKLVERKPGDTKLW